MTLGRLNVFVRQEKASMKITSVKTKTNAQLSTTEKKFAPMANASTEIPATFASAIQVSFLHKTKRPAWMRGKATVIPKLVNAGIPWPSRCREWTVVVTLAWLGEKLVVHVKIVLKSNLKNIQIYARPSMAVAAAA